MNTGYDLLYWKFLYLSQTFFLVDKFEEKNLNCNLEKLVSQLVLRLSLLNEYSHERKHKTDKYIKRAMT